MNRKLFSCVSQYYRRCWFTETGILKVIADLVTAADRGEVTLLSPLDLSAAFDTVDHDILIDRPCFWFSWWCSVVDYQLHHWSYTKGPCRKPVASARSALQSSMVYHRVVSLDQSCSCCTLLMCWSSLHVTASVSTRMLMTLSCTYIHRP